jgi:pSer/pThr/pTyr-binding forkhead associated (FHA) protein
VSRETVDDRTDRPSAADGAVPGVVAIFSAGRPVCLPWRIEKAIELGRDTDGLGEDDRLSRRHVRIDRATGHAHVRDLGSRNGTFVDGVRVEPGIVDERLRIVRVGQTVLVLVDDVRPFEERGVRADEDGVVGPALAAALDAVGRAAAAGDNVLVNGETGSGKERAARAFHALGLQASGPFVAINCATIPQGVAERLLFGSRKGAFSGATDTEGLVRAAHRGVLFLD